MHTRTFIPNISPDDINEALNTAENIDRGESVKKEIRAAESKSVFQSVGIGIGGLVIGIIFIFVFLNVNYATGTLAAICFASLSLLFIVFSLVSPLLRSSQKNPADPAKEFYSNVATPGILRNYGRAYQQLAPIATKQPSATTVGELEKTWKSVVDSLKSTVLESNQVTATCSVCGKEKVGVLTSKWGQKWKLDENVLKDPMISPSSDDFVFCDNCKTAYCIECYSKKLMPKKWTELITRPCKNCDSPMMDQFLDILVTHPQRVSVELEIDDSTTGISPVSYRNGVQVEKSEATNVADVVATVKGILSYETSFSKQTNKEPPKLNDWTFVFHNVSVQIGNTWYLMSAAPGDFSDSESQ